MHSTDSSALEVSGFLVWNVKFGVIEFRREQRNGRLVWKLSDQLDDRWMIYDKADTSNLRV